VVASAVDPLNALIVGGAVFDGFLILVTRESTIEYSPPTNPQHLSDLRHTPVERVRADVPVS